MNVLIIGASRGIGLRVAQQALDQGHQVTAVARTRPPLAGCECRLTTASADIEDRFAMRRLMAGQTVVVVTIGALPGFSPVYCFSRGTEVIIGAMQEAGVRRLIAVTGVGAGDSRGHGGWLYDRLFQPFVLGRIYQDKNRQERQIQASELDWTLVRPAILTHGPLTGEYQVHTRLAGVTADKISRADAAHFIVGQFDDRQYIHKAALLSY